MNNDNNTPQMSNGEAREIFSSAIEVARAAGNHDKAAELELCREFFTTEGFAEKLSTAIWKDNFAKNN